MTLVRYLGFHPMASTSRELTLTRTETERAAMAPIKMRTRVRDRMVDLRFDSQLCGFQRAPAARSIVASVAAE